MNFSAVILAGGRSQRMGRDKASLLLQGKTLLARQVELARELGATTVFISGREGVDYGSFDCEILKDSFENSGPLAGIESALTASSIPLLLVLAVDMPNLRAEELHALIAKCSKNCGAISRTSNRIEPLAAIYPRIALSLVRELLESGRRSATQFAERCVESKLANFVDFSGPQASHFENWNTPADVSEAVD